MARKNKKRKKEYSGVYAGLTRKKIAKLCGAAEPTVARKFHEFLEKNGLLKGRKCKLSEKQLGRFIWEFIDRRILDSIPDGD